MMPTKELSTSSVASDSRKGRQAVNLFRAAYDKANLNTVRAQALNEHPGFPKALLRLIEECSEPVMTVAPPEGGRIQVVRVPVNPARSWHDAACSLPNTKWLGFGTPISDAADAYPPIEGSVEQVEVILVNFGKNIGRRENAMKWAELNKLRPASPRTVFAVCEHKISLHLTLGVRFLRVFSTVLCEKYHYSGKTALSPTAVWGDSRRWADLVEFDRPTEECDWFAFIR